MTDKYPPEQEGQGAEIDVAERDEYGDHLNDPPVDDFSDEEVVVSSEQEDVQGNEGDVELGNETGTLDAEYGDVSNSRSAEDAVEAKKKMPKYILAGSLVGILALAGGFVYLQFFSDSQMPNAAPVSAPVSTAAPQPVDPAFVPPPSVVTGAPPSAVPSMGTDPVPTLSQAAPSKLDDIANLKPSMEPHKVDIPPTAIPVAAGDKPIGVVSEPVVTPPVAAPSINPLPVGVTGEQAQPAIPVVSNPSPALPPTLAAIPSIPSVPSVPSGAMPPNGAIPSASGGAVVQPAAGINPLDVARMQPMGRPNMPPDQMQGNPVGQQRQMPNMMAPSTVVPAGDPMAQAKIDELTARVEALQRSLDQAMDEVNRLNAAAAAKTMANDVQSSEGTPAKVVSQRKSREARSSNKPSKRATQRKAENAAETNSGKTSSWVLRAAVSGEAWIAKTAGSSDLRHVKVGDSVPGLGRITGVFQSGEGWVLEGTQGKIR